MVVCWVHDALSVNVSKAQSAGMEMFGDRNLRSLLSTLIIHSPYSPGLLINICSTWYSALVLEMLSEMTVS